MLEHRTIIFPVLHAEMFSTTCVAAQLPPGLCLNCKSQLAEGFDCSSHEPWGHVAPRRICAPSHWLGWFVPAEEHTPTVVVRDGGIKLPFLGPVVEKSVKHYVDPRDFSWKEGGSQVQQCSRE